MENATLAVAGKGKILIFKALVTSNVLHLAFVTDARSSTVAQLENIEKNFFLQKRNPKFEHTTLCNEYEKGGLKNVDFLLQNNKPPMFLGLKTIWQFSCLESDTFIFYQKLPREKVSISF